MGYLLGWLGARECDWLAGIILLFVNGVPMKTTQSQILRDLNKLGVLLRPSSISCKFIHIFDGFEFHVFTILEEALEDLAKDLGRLSLLANILVFRRDSNVIHFLCERKMCQNIGLERKVLQICKS